MKMWLNVGVETCIPWPGAVTEVPFAGRVFIIHPAELREPPALNDSASVSIAYDDGYPEHPYAKVDPRGEPRCRDEDEAFQLLQRFLSALAWYANRGIDTHNEQGAGHPYAVPESMPARVILPGESFDRLPEAADDDARIALALYREGLSVNRVSYQFLAFARVITIRHNAGAAFREWVNKSLPAINENDFDANRRLDSLRKDVGDVGEYLYLQRCSVAHALEEPRTDSDDMEKVARLRADLPLIRSLARAFMENELGIDSPATVTAKRREARRAARALISRTSR